MSENTRGLNDGSRPLIMRTWRKSSHRGLLFLAGRGWTDEPGRMSSLRPASPLCFNQDLHQKEENELARDQKDQRLRDVIGVIGR